MRAVIQRVEYAKVSVDKKIYGEIKNGLMVLIGVEQGDCQADAKYIVDKITTMRIFEDEQEKMNLSIIDKGYDILAISQFTLLGDARKGRRPSFSSAEKPKEANELFEFVCSEIAQKNINIQKGVFGAHMKVELCNDGPVTILLDSKKIF